MNLLDQTESEPVYKMYNWRIACGADSTKISINPKYLDIATLFSIDL